MKFKLIVAVCKGGGIGKNNTLPWKIKEDLTHFSKVTKGCGNNAIIMGRNTYISLGKVLPDRDNLILTKTINNETSCGTFFSDIDALIKYCEKKQYNEAWVIGGESIYKQFIDKNLIESCLITFIDNDYECDTFFHPPAGKFLLTKKTSMDTTQNYNIEIQEYIINQNMDCP